LLEASLIETDSIKLQESISKVITMLEFMKH